MSEEGTVSHEHPLIVRAGDTFPLLLGYFAYYSIDDRRFLWRKTLQNEKIVGTIRTFDQSGQRCTKANVALLKNGKLIGVYRTEEIGLDITSYIQFKLNPTCICMAEYHNDDYVSHWEIEDYEFIGSVDELIISDALCLTTPMKRGQ